MKWARLWASASLPLLLLAHPVEARIVKTRQPQQANPGLGLVLGSGFEYQWDGEGRQYEFPFLVEWAALPRLQLTLERSYLVIAPEQAETVHGLDELQSTLSFDLVRERRHRPAVSLEAGAQWPHRRGAWFNSGVTDVSMGVLLSKDLVATELALNAIYTIVGVPRTGEVRNNLKLSVASEWRLTSDLTLSSELLGSREVGPVRGEPTDPLGSTSFAFAPREPGDEWEATLGLARSFGPRFKIEPGLVHQSDGTWQAVVAWEWSLRD